MRRSRGGGLTGAHNAQEPEIDADSGASFTVEVLDATLRDALLKAPP